MAAEFRPKTGCKLAFLRPDPTPALAAVVGAAATASLASAVSIRRIIPPSPFSVHHPLLSASPRLPHLLAGLTGGEEPPDPISQPVQQPPEFLYRFGRQRLPVGLPRVVEEVDESMG